MHGRGTGQHCRWPVQLRFKPIPTRATRLQWKVFMTKDGRISLAGLNRAKAAYLAEAIVDSAKIEG